MSTESIKMEEEVEDEEEPAHNILPFYEKHMVGERIPADYSYLELQYLTSPDVPRRANSSAARQEPHRGENGRYVSKTLWLSNNEIQNLNGLTRFLAVRLEDPAQLDWIDLSFNNISEINQELLSLRELRILYLHGNCLNRWEEVGRLSSLEHLLILTLYGNPLEAAPDYRLQVIALLPALRRLDFSPVTSTERELAKTYEPKKKRKVSMAETVVRRTGPSETAPTEVQPPQPEPAYLRLEVPSEGSLSGEGEDEGEEEAPAEQEEFEQESSEDRISVTSQVSMDPTLAKLVTKLKEAESNYVFSYYG